MQPFVASSVEELSHPTPRLQKFLDLVDQLAETGGVSVPPIVEIEKLRTLPLGNFGRTWADFLDSHNLKPFTTGPRRKQLHDGIHVLTGYGTDPIGEAEVQAFLLGAKFSPINAFLGLLLLLGIYKQQRQYQNPPNFSWDTLWQAYKRGCNARFDPDSWQPELLWELPLTEVRTIFYI